MHESEIYAKLIGLFNDVFDDSSIVLGPETSAADVQSWDSFSHINLILAIESAFCIKFSSQDLEQMECVGDIVQIVKQKTS